MGVEIHVHIHIHVSGGTVLADFTQFEAAMTAVQSSLSDAGTRSAAEESGEQAKVDAATAALQDIKGHIDSFNAAPAASTPTSAQPPAGGGPSNPPTAPAGTPGSPGTVLPPTTTPPVATGTVTEPPATTVASPAIDPTSGKPLYTFAGGGSVDTSAWTAVTPKGSAGETLYTFVSDTAGAAPSGASSEWVVYTGTLV